MKSTEQLNQGDGEQPRNLLAEVSAPRLIFFVRREHKEETVPAERSALSKAQRAWPGA